MIDTADTSHGANAGSGTPRDRLDRLERLFALLDHLRRHRRPTVAARLAEDLGVSVRTIYRDIQHLRGFGAPIDGEAGVGFVLRPGYFLPPLTFTPDELEALILGARWVERQGDAGLATAARGALARIASAGGPGSCQSLDESGLFAPGTSHGEESARILADLRQAMRAERRVEISYTTANGDTTERVIWPVALAYFEHARMLAAWCELRQDFRHFRVDRIIALARLDGRFPRPRRALEREWYRQRIAPEIDGG